MSKKAITLSDLRWLVLRLKPESKIFGFGLFALLCGATLNLLIPEFIRRSLESDNLNYFLANPLYICGFFSVIFALQGVAVYMRIKLFTRVGLRVVYRLRADLFKRLLTVDPLTLETEKSGELVSRLTLDTAIIQDVVSIKFSLLIRYSLQVVIGIGLMLFFSPLLSGVLLVLLFALVVISIILAKRLKKLSTQTQDGNAQVGSLAGEVLVEYRTVVALNIQRFLEDKFLLLLDRVLDYANRRTNLSAFFQSFVSSLMNLSILLVVVLGIWITNQGQMTVGELSAFLLYGVIVAVSFAFVSSGYSELAQAFGAIERVRELIDRQTFLPESAASITKFESLRFRDVSFSYPKRENTTILNSLNFEILRGQRVALVGASGSGKSTVAALALGLFKASEGSVLLNDHDLRHLDSNSYAHIFSYVPQEPKLFSFSLRENLLLGKEDVNENEVYDLLKAFNIYDLVSQLDKGLETECGERGIQLSAGQRQRLAVARALIRKSQFLILDEATSALDTHNESSLIESLKIYHPDLTSLIIAHRLSTVKNCDRILVLSEGRIVQDGVHDELIALEGSYREMYARA